MVRCRGCFPCSIPDKLSEVDKSDQQGPDMLDKSDQQGLQGLLLQGLLAAPPATPHPQICSSVGVLLYEFVYEFVIVPT